MSELRQGMDALASGDLESARVLLAQAVAQAPLNADAYEGLASVLERQGRSELARDLCETALAQLPKAQFLHRKAVALSIEIDDLDGAERAAERYVLAFEADTESWLALGDVRAKIGNMERALRAYQHAHACDENDWRPWQRMGLMHEKKGDRRAACVAFRNAAREAPQNFRPLRALARVLQQLEKKDEAQEVFAEAQRLAADEETQSQN
jgi:tetratricopeptide (TPR) repeat protein